MPHVAFVPFTGLRIWEQELLALGMRLPGLGKRASAIAQLPALGLLTLAGLTPGHWSCSYHPAGEIEQEALLDDLVAERPTLIALSMLTASAEECYRFCAMLRRAGLRTVVGGLHATTCPDEASAYCDAVVVGQGEPVWLEVLADAAAGELRRIYRAPAQYDLANSPLPRFDLLAPAVPARFTVQTQRGCPLACEFCGASRLLGRFSEKPAALIERELASIRALAPRPLIELADDNTFAGKRDAEELCYVLARAEVRYFTEADWRIGTQPALLRRLADSGCVQVLVGMESQVFRYAGMGSKQSDWERIMDAVAAIQEAGVAVNGCFILGADGETPQSIDRLVEFILDSTLAEVQLTLQTPFPGTSLWRRLSNEGRLLADRVWPHYTLFDVTYQPRRRARDGLPRGARGGLFQRSHCAAASTSSSNFAKPCRRHDATGCFTSWTSRGRRMQTMSELTQTQGDEAAQVGISTLWRCWRGDRDAILEIASAKGVLSIGALFVLSAALAREYDGADLLAEPWHLAVPFVASVGTSLLLFSLLYGVGKLRGIGAVPFGRTYLRFLGLYWFTAPLAWLYAIPVEMFMSPLSATQSNLALLAMVSAWRVWLMTRVVRTLFGTSVVAAWSVVLFFADVVALVAVVVTPKPIISIMGGISHTDAEIAILTATTIVGFFCAASLPLWLASTATVAARGAPWRFALATAVPPRRPTVALRCFAAASVLLWFSVLPITQSQQRLAHRVDDQPRAGELREAVGEMASHNRGDFPARWDPPPHIGYGGREPPILDVMEVIVAMDSPPWVRALFAEKFGNTLYNPRILWGPDVINDELFHRYVHVLQKLPEGPSFAARQQERLMQADIQPDQSDAHRADIKALVDLAKTYDPDRDPPEHWARSY